MGNRGPKKFSESQHKGHAGIGLIHMLISEMGHEWHDRVVDVGIDGSIELRDPSTGLMSNQHVMVQSKASDARFPGETSDGFWYLCDEADIEYWLKSKDNPVILICSHPKERKAWWVHVQPWFKDPANRASRRIDFNKATQAFDGDFTGRLFALVDPHGVAHTPAAEFKYERLYTNLLPVDVPDLVYVAKTKFTRPGAVYATQKDSGLDFRSDFVLKGGRIYMWDRPEGTSLEKVVAENAKGLPFGELAGGDTDAKRLAVWLLKAALQQDLRADCRWNNSRKFLHLRPTSDLTVRRLASLTGRERIAFNGYYQRKDDPSKPQFYRHAALRPHFSQVDGEWFCEVVADYFYTEDGYTEYRYADKMLGKMKRLEKNAARLGETLMWMCLLIGETKPDLFYEPSATILDFGPPVTFTLDRGITDKNWRTLGEAIEESGSDVEAIEALDDELTLFDILEGVDQ